MPAIMIAYYTEPGYDDIQMLATSGLIVSHEIGHLFDTRGAIYDEYGILRDW